MAKFVERSFVMVKPDGVQRGLVGECVKRLEQCGLKIVAMKMLVPTQAMIEKHYPSSEDWFRKVGEKSKATCDEEGIALKQKFGTDDLVAVGKQVKKWLVKYISSGPVVVMAVEGYRAIDNVRKLCGNTQPLKAEAGSIRGAFSFDAAGLSNQMNRPISNIIHASGDKAEAENELKLWFTQADYVEYKRCDEDIFYKAY